MIGVLGANLFTKLLLELAAAVDSMIYWFVSVLMGLLINVSNITIEIDLINNFASRIYIVLGIFMLFKLTINLLNVIVNPEALTDKENGTSKIVVRIVIALIMLLAVQPVFKLAIDMQASIIRTVPSLILGTPTGQGGLEGSGAEKNGTVELIAAQTFKSFVSAADACPDSAESILGATELTINGVASIVTKTCPWNNGSFMFEYMFGFSGLTGLFLAFTLLTYCVDVAVRMIKLAVLQLLAPIPIISYADPKASKKSFSSWIKMCGTAYVDLFIKLAIIYFVIFLVGQLSAGKGFVNSDGTKISGFLFVLLVIGIFFFAKQAPQYIADIFGIKLDKGGSFLGKALGILGGGALGGITGGAGSFLTGLGQTKSLKGALGAAKTGFQGGASAGLTDGMGGANQFRKQANDIAQKLTGDPTYKTGIVNSAVRGLKNKAKSGQERLNQRFDNKGNKIVSGYSSQIDSEADNIASQDSGYQAYGAQLDDLSMQSSGIDQNIQDYCKYNDFGSGEDGRELRDSDSGYQALVARKESIQQQMTQTSQNRDSYKDRLKADPKTQAAARENVIESTPKLKNNKYVAAGRNRETAKENKKIQDNYAEAFKKLDIGKK